MWIILAGGLGALVWWMWREEPLAVDVAEVERGVVEAVVTNTRAGAVRARLRSKLGSETSGRVSRIVYREGAEVDSGAVLVELADAVVRAQVALAHRDLEAARARLASAQATAAYASREFERARGLRERHAISQEAFDAAESRDETAHAELQAAQAQVERARAALVVAERELARHQVRAPFAGVVNALYVEVGTTVVPGQALLELMNVQDLYVRAPMDELDLAALRVGQPARVSLDPYPDRRFPARIVRVAPFVSELQEQNRTVDVELVLEALPADVVLAPGTSADVEIITARHDSTLRIPAVALLEGSRAYRVDGDRLEEVAVHTGLRNWDWIEVVAGLDAGDRVVTRLDRTRVRPGMKVEVRRVDGAGE